MLHGLTPDLQRIGDPGQLMRVRMPAIEPLQQILAARGELLGGLRREHDQGR